MGTERLGEPFKKRGIRWLVRCREKVRQMRYSRKKAEEGKSSEKGRHGTGKALSEKQICQEGRGGWG